MMRSIILLGLFLMLFLLAPVAYADEGSGEVTGTVTIALSVSDVSASHITTHSATIFWKTNGPADSLVEYGTTTVYGYQVYDEKLVSEHSVTLTGLSSSTTYHYRVKSVAMVDGSEFIAISEGYTFTTLSPPEVEEVAPPPPAPPAPPPGTTPVSDIVTTDGLFTEEVIAESFDNLCHLTIAEGTKGLTKEKEPLSQIIMVEMEELPTLPADVYVIGLVYDFSPHGATFDPPIMLTVIYDPSLIPEGVAEENLVIAYYNGDSSQWIELDSVVDTKANVVSAKVSHFTAFAVFGYEVVVPPVVPPVIPAAFTVSGLTISPGEVYVGERVSISVIVSNIGGQSGSYEVTLKINGVVEATREVTVNTGFSKEVTFSTTRDVAGTYLVDVDPHFPYQTEI